MVTTVRSLGLQGIGGYEVRVECFLSNGLPAFDMVGLPDTAVKEALGSLMTGNGQHQKQAENLKQLLKTTAEPQAQQQVQKHRRSSDPGQRLPSIRCCHDRDRA